MLDIEKLEKDLKEANDMYNAVVSICDLKDGLDAVSQCSETSLLYGVPIAVKDNIVTKDHLTTASSKMLENYIPPFDATVVERLKENGALIAAKTTMDEFGMGGFGRTSISGPTLNPKDISRVAGGSSSGSAALVASGVVAAALGTDTGDSVRHPASYCGIVGLKPTYGRVSRYGVIPFASSLDHVGVLSQDVLTSAQVLEAIAGYDPKDMTTSQEDVPAYSRLIHDPLKSKKIGVIKNVVDAIEQKDVVEDFKTLINCLEKEGFEIVEIEFNQELFRLQNVLYQVISNAEVVSNLSSLDGITFGNRQDGESLEEIMINSRTDGFGHQVRERMLKGGYALLEEHKEDTLFKAQKIRRMLVDDINDKKQGVDFLLAPASGRVAPKLDDYNYDVTSDNYLIANNYMVMDNFSGHPGITVPYTECEGLPVGVYISAKPYEEVELLKVAKIVEDIVGDC